MADVVPAAPVRRRIELHRRVAIIRPDVIQVRPSRAALLRPLTWLLIGAACFAAIIAGLNSLPVVLLAVLLLVAVIAIPLAGLGVVYGLVGAHVVIDRTKQSATWQQGMIGLGIGTQDLVPFAKIAAIAVEEAGSSSQDGGGPTEELAQWQIVLEKTSGRRLVIGGATAPRSLAESGLERAAEVARAISDISGAPLRLPQPAPSTVPAPVTATPRARRRRRDRRRVKHR